MFGLEIVYTRIYANALQIAEVVFMDAADMQLHTDVVCMGHVTDFFDLGDAACVAKIRLYDTQCAVLIYTFTNLIAPCVLAILFV